MKRRIFVSLTGTALTAPAHHWLVHEPEPLISGLSGRRISAGFADRLTAMVTEVRKMDDVAGGGVLTLAQHDFSWVAGLLDHAHYEERTGRMLHLVLAEAIQLTENLDSSRCVGQFAISISADAARHRDVGARARIGGVGVHPVADTTTIQQCRRRSALPCHVVVSLGVSTRWNVRTG